jgi:hypothetical protein
MVKVPLKTFAHPDLASFYCWVGGVSWVFGLVSRVV